MVYTSKCENNTWINLTANRFEVRQFLAVVYFDFFRDIFYESQEVIYRSGYYIVLCVCLEILKRSKTETFKVLSLIIKYIRVAELMLT